MAVCLLLEGFFSGSEIGVVGADTMKLRHDAAKGSKGAKLALKMLENPEWLLSTTLVGTNIAVVTNTTMGTALMIHLFGLDVARSGGHLHHRLQLFTQGKRVLVRAPDHPGDQSGKKREYDQHRKKQI